DVDLALGGADDRARVVEDRVEALELEDLGLSPGAADRRQRLLEVVERLRVSLAQLVQQLVRRDAHVLDAVAALRARDDPVAGETLKHGVDLRRGNTRRPA